MWVFIISKKLPLFERKRMGKRIAILASGVGSNAERIIKCFQENNRAEVVLLGSNKADALVLNKAEDLGVQTFVFNKDALTRSGGVLYELLAKKVDLIVLAGVLLKVPEIIIQAFPNRIINVHPALLPKFGGKGMYGKNVHNAVLKAGEKESGITIHYVNKEYDEGAIIFQVKCVVDKNDDVVALAKKIQILEHQYFSKTIDKLIQTL